MVENKLVSKHIRMSVKIAKWYEDKAQELGVSQTNLMVMALNDYIKQENALRMPSDIETLIDQIKEISAKAKKGG